VSPVEIENQGIRECKSQIAVKTTTAHLRYASTFFNLYDSLWAKVSAKAGLKQEMWQIKWDWT